MKPIYIQNATIYAETEMILNGALLMEKGRIAAVFRQDERPAHLPSEVIVIDGTNLNVIPGFIDGHIHGAAGADVMDGTEEALDVIAAALPAEGTTGFLATTMTEAPERLDQALANTAAYTNKPGQAEMLGVHLEGPFINKDQAGAQPQEHIIAPDIIQFEIWQKMGGGIIKTITMAPEVDETGAFTRWLHASGITISAGHTNIGFDGMTQAAAYGVCQVTHLCNAMSGIHHRDIGVVGAAFQLKELRAELIADGVHVSQEMINLIYNNIGSERLMLITDAIRAKCLAPGRYELGGQPVTVSADRAVLQDGTLAGSILKMCDAARCMLQMHDATMRDIISMASVNPAKQIGLFDRKAGITAGKDADILIVDDELNLKYTICRGVIAYEEDE